MPAKVLTLVNRKTMDTEHNLPISILSPIATPSSLPPPLPLPRLLRRESDAPDHEHE